MCGDQDGDGTGGGDVSRGDDGIGSGDDSGGVDQSNSCVSVSRGACEDQTQTGTNKVAHPQM